jgi:hypothetical protein
MMTDEGDNLISPFFSFSIDFLQVRLAVALAYGLCAFPIHADDAATVQKRRPRLIVREHPRHSLVEIGPRGRICDDFFGYSQEGFAYCGDFAGGDRDAFA